MSQNSQNQEVMGATHHRTEDAHLDVFMGLTHEASDHETGLAILLALGEEDD